MKTTMILLICFFYITSCDAIMDAITREPDVVVTSQNIYNEKTGNYEWIYCDELPADAVYAIGHDGTWYAQVPVYQLVLYTAVKNRGDDSAGNVTGHIYIYADEKVIEKLTISYASLLYPGERVEVRRTLASAYYDYFDIELTYRDANTEEYEDDCCCECY